MTFLEERLVDCPRVGSSFSYRFKTDIKELANGAESRVALWDLPRMYFTIDLSALEPSEMREVLSAFMVARGSLYGFRYRNLYDYKMDREAVAQKDGSNTLVFQLVLPFAFGNETFYKPIYKIVEGTFSMRIGATQLSEGSDYTADYNTGVIEITSSETGTVYITCEYDTPVRFVTDDFDIDPVITRGKDGFVSNTSIQLIELMGTEVGVMSKEEEEVVYIPVEGD